MSELQVKVDGRWLSIECLYGEVEKSTVWPGGSDEMAWTPGTQPFHRFRGGETVEAYLGGYCVWSGSLNEPDPSQEQQTAVGAYREGDWYPALDGVGNATAVPDTAIDAAITSGLNWTRPVSISSVAVDIDVSQGPVQLSSLLDSWAQQAGQRWAVDAFRQVYASADPTLPAYQTFPLDEGLGFALDNYASTLVGRYKTSGGYATATRTNTDAEFNHGHRAVVVDLTPRGVLTATKANTILDNMLALGKAIPQWTSGIVLTYGEVLGVGSTPVALESVTAGNILRIPGGFELAQRLNGQMYLDVLIGRTQLSGGELTIQPLSVAIRTLTDALTAALAPKT